MEANPRPAPVSVYEIGYRIPTNPGFDPYNTSYTEVCIVATLGEAQLLCNRLSLDFPTAEWRMVESIHYYPYNLSPSFPYGAWLTLMAGGQ